MKAADEERGRGQSRKRAGTTRRGRERKGEGEAISQITPPVFVSFHLPTEPPKLLAAVKNGKNNKKR